jgi:hypothetical protein
MGGRTVALQARENNGKNDLGKRGTARVATNANSFKNLYPQSSHLGLERVDPSLQADPCVANTAVTPPPSTSRKVSQFRFGLVLLVTVFLLALGVFHMEGDSRFALLIGVAPLVLVMLVCVCSPCVKNAEDQDPARRSRL